MINVCVWNMDIWGDYKIVIVCMYMRHHCGERVSGRHIFTKFYIRNKTHGRFRLSYGRGNKFGVGRI